MPELTGTPTDPNAPASQRNLLKGFVYRTVPHATLKSIANSSDEGRLGYSGRAGVRARKIRGKAFGPWEDAAGALETHSPLQFLLRFRQLTRPQTALPSLYTPPASAEPRRPLAPTTTNPAGGLLAPFWLLKGFRSRGFQVARRCPGRGLAPSPVRFGIVAA